MAISREKKEEERKYVKMLDKISWWENDSVGYYMIHNLPLPLLKELLKRRDE